MSSTDSGFTFPLSAIRFIQFLFQILYPVRIIFSAQITLFVLLIQSQVPEADSPDSGSVSERLPSSTRSFINSPVEEAQRKDGAKVIKKRRARSSQKSNQDKHTKDDVDMELLKTAKSIAEGLQADQRTVTEVEDEELFYCKSLATRMRSPDPQSKAYVRMQIEPLITWEKLPLVSRTIF